MIRWIALLLGLCVVSLAVADIYKTIGPDGSVIFSDKPVDQQSTEVKLKPVSVSTSKQNTPKLTPQMLKPDENLPPVQKPSINFIKPSDGETIWNQADIEVVTQVQPDLAKGDRVRLLVNNKAVQTNDTGKFELTYFERGTQYLRAEIIGNDGQVKASTKSITIYVHRTIIKYRIVPSSITGVK